MFEAGACRVALSTERSARLSKLAKLTVAGFVLASLLAALAFLPVSALQSAQAASSNQLGQELDDVRSELEKVRANIEKAEIAKKAALGDIAALDQSIEIAETALGAATAARDAAVKKLAAVREQLDQVTAELTAKESELAEAEIDLQEQQEILERRVVDVYKSGGSVTYLAVLLEADSFADLIGRVALLGDIIEQDNAVLGDIKGLKAQIEQAKVALEQKRTQVAALEREQTAATKELKAAANKRQASLDELETSRAAKKEVVAAAEASQAAWTKQEDELLAESDRIAELLRGANVDNPVKAGSGVLSWPVDGEVTSGFGYRIHPIFNVRKLHTGIDIDADMGDAIHAAAAGTVASAGWQGGYGKCVIITHNGGLATLYGHQSEILVSAGQEVKRGEVIGRVGSTGYSTGPHLHFEVRVNGSPVDPLGYL